MQIGIDIGATKIESVILDENGAESFRERIECPKNYIQTVETIMQIVFSLDKKLNNQTPWKEISRSLVGQLETGACLETKSVYFDITNTKGIPRNSH